MCELVFLSVCMFVHVCFYVCVHVYLVSDGDAGLRVQVTRRSVGGVEWFVFKQRQVQTEPNRMLSVFHV